MASDTTRNIAMMAIRPIYAEKIISGEKLVEFRRTKLRDSVTHILIYATAPRKEIIGLFEVASIDEGTPSELWDQYNHVGCIARDNYENYFGGTSKGYAIKVGRVYPTDFPLPLGSLDASLTPPQSFYYVETKILKKIISSGILAMAR